MPTRVGREGGREGGRQGGKEGGRAMSTKGKEDLVPRLVLTSHPSPFLPPSLPPSLLPPGMEDSTTVVAIRDMVAGEEVTIDYATVNSGINTSEGDNFQCW